MKPLNVGIVGREMIAGRQYYEACGAAELAAVVRAGRPHRASAEPAYHVLDICHSILESAESGRAVQVRSSAERPAPLPEALLDDITA